MYTHIHTYIHTFIHSFIHSFIYIYIYREREIYTYMSMSFDAGDPPPPAVTTMAVASYQGTRHSPPRPDPPVVCPGFRFDKIRQVEIPGYTLHASIERDKLASVHWSAARNEERRRRERTARAGALRPHSVVKGALSIGRDFFLQ